MNSRQLWFNRPYSVEIRELALPALAPDAVQVHTLYSGISAGTEMLVYRGELPPGMTLDATLDTMKQQSSGYPLQYGYAAVGRVEKIGSSVDPAWDGKLVFAFHPHASRFHITPANLVTLPESIEPQAAVFLANMETAVNLALDGNPRLGEKVVILGQGVVGLLTLAILARYPLKQLYALDTINTRRIRATELGAGMVIDPASTSELAHLKAILRDGADLVYELTGIPSALNLAIDLCGYGSRIVSGSWYGTRSAELQLGGSFHRNRIRLSSSQVSTIAPELSGRWDKARRYETAWDLIKIIQPETLITHCIPFSSAAEAYTLLHQSPDSALQVVFEYN